MTTLALFCLTGCSFLFVNDAPRDPSERTAQAAEECTTGAGWPAFDAVGVPVAVLNAALVAQSDEISDSTKPLLIATSLAWAGVDVASAIYGFRAIKRCKELQRELEQPSGPAWHPAGKTDSAP